MSSEPVIRVSQLCKSFPIYARPADRLKQFILPRIQRMLGLAPKQYYKTFTALSDINFEIHKGETVGIIGHNGAGKSTLLQILCGTLSPTSGEVEVKGRVAALLELGAGFNGEYTGRENVYMNARILGLTDEEIDARFDEIVAFADIGVHLEQPVKTYSSGMYVRLAFAVVAHVDADVLIVDEALAVGDAFFNQQCMRFLQKFKASGTLIFVTHDATVLLTLCERSIWINKGNVVGDDTTKVISSNYLANRYADEDQPNFIQYDQHKNSTVSFGTQKIVIEQVKVARADQTNSLIFSGEESVSIKLRMRALESVSQVVCGFNVKNKWGQIVFGDNTLRRYALSPYKVNEGDVLHSLFLFIMPKLGTGLYSIDVAVAEGDALSHQQLHWIYDAIFIEFRHEFSHPNTLRIDCIIAEISNKEI